MGLRVLVNHWPALVVLYLAGFAARMGSIWLAVRAARISSVLAALVIPLAPLATIVSFVLMLRVAAESLPAFGEQVRSVPRQERWRRNLGVAAMALAPFLAVYASQGLMVEDLKRFALDAGAAEWAAMDRADFSDTNFARAGLATGSLAIGIALVAMVLRKVIAALGLGERTARWALLAGYLEALWTSSLGYTFTSEKSALVEWITTRRIVAGVYRRWEGVIGFLDGIHQALTAPVEAVGAIVGSMGGLVVVPVAWLAVGATVYGTSLKEGSVLPTHEAATERLRRVPHPIRRITAQVTEPVTTPFRSAVAAIGKVASAGVVPMVLFCVVFAVTGWVRVGVDVLARRVMGPAEQGLQAAREPFVTLVDSTIYFVLTIALLSAAVNHIVSAQQQAATVDEPAKGLSEAARRAGDAGCPSTAAGVSE